MNTKIAEINNWDDWSDFVREHDVLWHAEAQQVRLGRFAHSAHNVGWFRPGPEALQALAERGDRSRCLTLGREMKEWLNSDRASFPPGYVPFDGEQPSKCWFSLNAPKRV